MKKNWSALRFLLNIACFFFLISGFSFAQWNNSNFIDDSFWATNPSTGQIITALFGTGTSTGTAYTNHWQNNACVPANMSVQYLNTAGALDATTITDNTIYVITTNQVLTTTKNIYASCVAIVNAGHHEITDTFPGPSVQHFFAASNSEEGLIIDGIIGIGSSFAQSLLFSNSYKNITVNNIIARGFDGGPQNRGVLYLQTNAEHALIRNSEIYNNNKAAIKLNGSNNIHIVGNILHINTNAIELQTSPNVHIENNHIMNNDNGIITLPGIQPYITITKNRIFNNNQEGIEAYGIQYSIISNNIIHNNGQHGIKIGDASNLVIDTNQVYNNQNRAISITGPLTNSILHNLRLISTVGETLFIAAGTNNKFYGPIQLYGTNANISAGGLTAGVASDPQINGLGWTNGFMTNTTTATQLINTQSRISCALGAFHIGFFGVLSNPCKDNGIQTFTRTQTPYYYGELTLKQRSIPTYFSGSNPTTTLRQSNMSFNPQLYITDNNFGGWIQTTGGANYENDFIHYTNTNQLIIHSSRTAQYNIAGQDIALPNPNNFNPPIITGTIQSGQTITINLPWTGDDGHKNIVGRFSTGGIETNRYKIYRRYDTTGPDQIILNSPTQNAQVVGNQVTLDWSAGVDTGAGLSGYNYRVASDSGFTNILFSGTTGVLTTDFVNIGFYPNYYRQVQGFDNLGNTGTATTGVFHYGFGYFDMVPVNTTFPTNSGQTFTVTAYDINNNIITGYTNTVTFTLTGTNTTPQTPPANYTFTLADNGSHTFTGLLTINYPGVYVFDVMDTLSNTRLGSTTVTVTGQAPALFSGTMQTNPSTATSGMVDLSITSSAPATYGIRIDNIPRQAITPINTTTTMPLDLSTLPQNGTYTITVVLYDNNGIYTYTMTQSIIYDSIAPVITIQSPTTGSYQTLNQPWLERTVVETGAGMSGYTVVMSGQSQVYTATNQMNNNYRAGTPLPDGIYTMTVYGYDLAGNVGTSTVTFTIDNTPPVILSGYPHQVIIPNPITFTWNVLETGGIEYSNFWLMDYYNNPITNMTQVAGPNTSISVMDLGLGTLAPGVYRWNVEVRDQVGFRGHTPNYNGFIFAVHNALPGQIQGFMEFQSIFGNVVQHNGVLYTNTTQLQAALFANMPSNVSINGSINPNIVGVPLLAPYPYTLQAVNLTPGDGVKNINALFSTGTLNPFSVAKQITLDTIAPTPAQPILPVNGAIVSGDILFSRTGGVDTGAGLGQYSLEITQDATFNNIMYGRGVEHPTQTFTVQSGWLQTGTYYRRIKSYDRVRNGSNSEVRTITITGPSTTPPVNPANVTPNTFTLNTINNATPNLAYKSNTISVAGLATGQQALASVSAGTLFINGSGVGTTGLVINGDIVEVELIASSQYNTQVSSTLSIGTRSAIFHVRTINQDDLASYNGLTNTQRFQIRIIFDALVNTYGENDARTLSLFITMRTAIESMLGLNTLNIAQKDALEFFLTLVNNYINTKGGVNPFNGARYEARNGRIFTITFDPTRVAYTSPEFIKPAFFASWTAMKHHIDIHNPGSLPGTVIGNVQDLSGNRGADVEVMPNGKIYRVDQKPNGMRYSQDTLSGREFTTRAGLVSWLRYNNQQIKHF